MEEGAEITRRVVRLASAENVRDLGGLKACRGAETRLGRLLRGALPAEPTRGDAELLIDRLGLRTVVDLRTRGEVRHHSVRWLEHGVAWVHCPFRLGGFGPVPEPGADCVAAYLGFLETDDRPMVLAARTLMSTEHQPALFHCAAGKDRTGVLSAMLLDVLGVEAEAIAADYALTTAAMPHVLDRLVELDPYRDSLAGADAAEHTAEAETMLAFLAELHERYGGAAEWLLEHGVERESIDRFRVTMITTATPDTSSGYGGSRMEGRSLPPW